MTDAGGLLGKHVLIVEDEALIAMCLADHLEDLACTYKIAVRPGDALGLLGAEVFDAVTLDMNLDGEPTLEIAETLRSKRIPFVIVTGYEMVIEYPGIPIVRKPYTAREIEAALLSALDRRGDPSRT